MEELIGDTLMSFLTEAPEDECSAAAEDNRSAAADLPAEQTFVPIIGEAPKGEKASEEVREMTAVEIVLARAELGKKEYEAEKAQASQDTVSGAKDESGSQREAEEFRREIDQLMWEPDDEPLTATEIKSRFRKSAQMSSVEEETRQLLGLLQASSGTWTTTKNALADEVVRLGAVVERWKSLPRKTVDLAGIGSLAHKKLWLREEQLKKVSVEHVGDQSLRRDVVSGGVRNT